jgi:predicted ATPase/DNA-binding SARP family transcriptional activator
MTAHESLGAPGAELLPVHLTRFIGRDHELEELSSLVGSARLLTLTGAGGSGKTRLAREVALRASGEFDRVVWADLAPVGEPALLPVRVAADLHVPDRAVGAPVEWIIATIGEARVLLVLDNCEHLVDAAADFADALLRACPRLTILTTSREALGVCSELAWLVPPLARDDAMQLFVERARETLPALTLTASGQAAIEEICRRLDGIPLAIELAAVRVRVLTPEQIARRLDDAFRLLTTGSRTALPRHRTLRATMDWSYGLLSAREQALLRRLAVFAGGFTLSAAEAVCAGESLDADDILDGVSALVDKSLVLMDPGEGEARYGMLETVRQYALDRLAESGECARMEERHAIHFRDVAEVAAPNLVGGSNAPPLLARMRKERDNLRAACAWAVADPARTETAMRLVGALFWFWYAEGQFRESREFADRALALGGPAAPLHRGCALVTSALTALAQGEYGLAERQFEEALPVLRESGDAGSVGSAWAKYGASVLLGGDVPRAIGILDDVLAFTDGWPAHDNAVIFARFWRAWAAYLQRDLPRARELLEASVEAARRERLPTTMGHGLVTLARVEVASGNIDRARELATEGFEIEVAIDDAWGIGIGIDVVALIAVNRGRLEDAVRLLAAVEAHRRRIVLALPGISQSERDALFAHGRSSLGAQFEALYQGGLSLSTAEAVRLALGELTRDTTELRIVPEIGHYAEPASRNGARAERLRLLALGPLQVFVGERLIEPGAWGSARPRELLIYLAMHEAGRTKEQAGLAFWPDASAAQLRNNFHVTLHRLRKALGNAEWVALAGDRYRIAPEALEHFDVREFEHEVVEAQRSLQRREEGAVGRFERAVGLFRGDFLDGEPVGDWHLEHRDRLQRLYVDALMSLGAHLARDERHAKAAEAFRRVLARDELHEEAVQALIRCHAAMGERSQALRVYRRFTELLQRELEAEPDRETSRLAERLQEGIAI